MNHDDRIRALRARTPAITGTNSEPVVSDAPVQLSRELVDAAIARSAAIIDPPSARTQRRYVLAQGAMKRFLDHARTVQKLPHFAARMRS